MGLVELGLEVQADGGEEGVGGSLEEGEGAQAVEQVEGEALDGGGGEGRGPYGAGGIGVTVVGAHHGKGIRNSYAAVGAHRATARPISTHGGRGCWRAATREDSVPGRGEGQPVRQLRRGAESSSVRGKLRCGGRAVLSSWWCLGLCVSQLSGLFVLDVVDCCAKEWDWHTPKRRWACSTMTEKHGCSQKRRRPVGG